MLILPLGYFKCWKVLIYQFRIILSKLHWFFQDDTEESMQRFAKAVSAVEDFIMRQEYHAPEDENRELLLVGWMLEYFVCL